MTQPQRGMIPREELLPLLGVVKRSGSDLLAFCPVPAHDDGAKHGHRGGQSLVLHASGVLQCMAGCSFEDVMRALRRDQPDQRPAPAQSRGEPVKVYEYRDSTGKLLAVKGRFETPNPDGKPEKRFLWRLPEGSWRDGIKQAFPLGVVEMPLWRAERLVTAPKDQRVWLTEGEKACEAVEARQELAVCAAWGASQADFGLAFEALRGRDVLLWPDNDQPGREYMARVKRHLHEQGIARSIAVVNAPVPPKGDAVEYFASGGTIEGLLNGVLLRPTVDVLSSTAFRVRVPTETGIPVLFEFEDVERKGARSLEAELSVTYGSGDSFVEGVNTLSQSGRETLARQLGNHFGKDVNWTTALNTAYSKLKEAFEETQHAAVEMLGGHTEPSRVSFLLEPYVVRGAGTILFGPPERGKSWTAMLMAVSIDADNDSVWPVRHTPTLYVNLERDRDSMARRMARVNMALGEAADRPLAFINARGKTLMDVAEAIKRAIQDKGIEFIVLDSVSRAGAGDLNENQTANRIMDMLNGFGVSWLAIAHTPRGDDTHIYGSVQQDAAADVMVNMSSETGFDGTLGVGLQIVKANDFRRPPAERLAYEMDEEYGLSAVRKAKEHEFIEVEAKEKRTVADQIATYLKENGASTGASIAAAINGDPGLISRLLNKSPWFVFVRQAGREKFYGLAARAPQEERLTSTLTQQSSTGPGIVDLGLSLGSQQSIMPPSDSTEGVMECCRCHRQARVSKYTPDLLPLCAACGDEEA